jgi:L-histidine Nalpha-methyltransferase
MSPQRPAPDDTVAALREGLLADPPRLPAALFYDDVGSALFERITALPEYYQTRSEIAILEREAAQIIEQASPIRLAELGAGTARKIGRLIQAMSQGEGCWDVTLLDVNAAFVQAAAVRLQDRFPETRVRGIAARYPQDLHIMGPGGRRLVCFFGSTIGNLTDTEAVALLVALRRASGRGDHLLIGFDLVKDPAVLRAAYNDAAGLTAEFNRNILRALARVGAGDVPVDAFVHEATWHDDEPRIEMKLRATRDVRLSLPAIGVERSLPAGQAIVTERCAKYTRQAAGRLAARGGWTIDAWFTDEDRLFALGLLA